MRALTPLRFADRFELQPQERRLLVDGQAVPLGARALDVLIALAERSGQLVSKNELIDLVWPNVIVEENNLQVQISALRKILGGDIIATIPGRGYRFTVQVDDRPAERAAPDSLAVAPAASRQRTNLPTILPELIGRADDLAALTTLLEQHRLITIVGAGGMGKTRVAQTLLQGRRTAYAHGVCWVELAEIATPGALPGAIAGALGVRLEPEDPQAALRSAVSSLDLLLALDNAEHLLADVARLAEALHDAAPNLRLLVTSQAPLKVAAERVYRLEALTAPQGPVPPSVALGFGAVALFVERAQGADARFTLTDANAPAVITLCHALDGLALAIELAAARAPMLGVQRLAESLDERLRLLTTSRNRSAPARQQTLRAALEWSHGFLDERERIVFRRLAVIAGSASLELIEEVAADPPGAGELDRWAVLDALTVLVDRSLVAVVISDDPVAAPRYRLLDSTRAYARELLAGAGEADALAARHARAVVGLCEQLYELRFSGRVWVRDWEVLARPDIDNAQEAVAWARRTGDTNAALALCATLMWMLPFAMHVERLALCDMFDEMAQRSEALPLLICRASQVVATQLNRSGRSVYPVVDRAIALGRQLQGTDEGRFYLYQAVAQSLTVLRPGHEHEIAELRALEDPTWPPQRLRFGRLGLVGAATDPREALLLTERWIATLEAAGENTEWALVNLVDAQLGAGEAHAAAQTGNSLLARAAGSRDESTRNVVRVNTAAAHLALGDVVAARVLAETWLDAPELGQRVYWFDYLGLLAALEGRPRTAARLLGRSDAWYGERARQPNEANALERAERLARGALGDAEFERLRAEGATLRDDELTLALAIADSL